MVISNRGDLESLAQKFTPIRSNATQKEIVATEQKVEAKSLVEGVKLYFTEKLDVFSGVVREI